MARAASESVTGKAARFVIRDVFLDVLRFPIWWYTKGTANVSRLVWQELLTILNRLSLPILFRNLLKPMYGDYSKSGRAISLVMRLVVFGFKAVGFALWALMLLLLFVLWIGALPAAVFQVVRVIGGY